MARPGISPALAKLAADVKEVYLKNRPDREAVYRQLDGSGREVMSIAEWRKVCTNPVFEMNKLIAMSVEMISDNAKTMAERGRQHLWWTSFALVVAIMLGGGGVWLVHRRVARPVKVLTATIQRLARRDYGEAVTGGGHQDEFDTMATALETLRFSGLEAEQMAAAQLAAKEADLQRAQWSRPRATNSIPRSARCWMRSTPPARI